MATDYDKIYRQSRHAHGPPTREFVDFFRSIEMRNARVLGISCGQGRDALFIARLRHRVTAIDLAPAGIRHLREEASNEDLDIQATVADIRVFVPARDYDVIVIDRTPRMLPSGDCLDVLAGLLPFTIRYAAVLIADERSSVAAFETLFRESAQN